MNLNRPVLFSLLAVAGLGVGFAVALEGSTKQRQREEDRRAIHKLTQEMTQAFESRDSAAIAAHWTENGEFVRNDGEPIRGRAEIQRGYAKFFKTLSGKPKLEVQSDAVRFPSADMAVSQTTLRLKDNDGGIAATARQETALVREGGQWKVASVREWDRNAGLDVNLEELAWLIGTWRAAAEGRTVTITYEWDESKAFIRGRFAINIGDKVVESGTEIIGKDNAAGNIRSWFFESDGSFGGAVWSREGKKWSLDLQGVRAEGSQLTATVTYLPVDPAAFVWRAANQTLDGASIADTPPIKVAKQQ